MPRALRYFNEAEAFNDTRRRLHWDTYDPILLGVLTASAAIAIAAFAFVALGFFAH